MSILVTGASGFIGRHLTNRLLEQGVSVRVVTRHPERLPVHWSGHVDIVAGTLTDKSVIKDATHGTSLIFHLAAETQNLASMWAVNSDVVRELIAAASAAGVKRFVHLSSVGVIGPEQEGEVTEESPCCPKNEYERTKLEGERAVLAFAKSRGFDSVVIRPTIVFGEGTTGSRDSMLEWLRALQKDRFVFIGRDAVANYVYVGDVVEAMVRLSERPFPGGETFHVSDPAPMRDFVGAMAEALRVSRLAKTVPCWAAYAAGAGLEAANRLFGTPAPLTISRVRALSSTCWYSGDKLRTRAGFMLPFGFRVGLARTVRWYQGTGQL